MQEAEQTIELLDTGAGDLNFQQELSALFDGDGRIYLVSGYFTYQGYVAIRDAIADFLDRSPDNELVVVVGPASDQFSPRIARDLWSLDENDQVTLRKHPRGLHAKLFIRDGPNPRVITGSANITQVAFEYNLELNLAFSRESAEHPDIRPFLEWVETLTAKSQPLRRRDLLAPVLIGSSMINWSNKARLLPTRNVILRMVPVFLILLAVLVSARVI